MTVYMVMAPPPSRDLASDAEDMVFIKEGFCWPAFFFSAPWLVFRGLWLVLFGYLIAAIVVAGVANVIGGYAPTAVGIAFAILFALEANSLRRWTLERRGWDFVGLVAGENRDTCEARFFAKWAPHVDHAARPKPGAAPAAAATPDAHGARAGVAQTGATTLRPSTPSDAVIGLFPEATR
ncbi:DUF2628 domain-containing protein [Breoghania sp.]|uniref:DUF2628 domain-containing protein n=1 Tax=Breoghania sp. TaxID=2065378 RepID=UPI002AAC2349|nr:DUF2628 domain-containing protein [Breoghania sp.]